MADVLPRRNLPEDAEPWGRRIEEIVGRLSDNMGVVTTNVRTQLTNASRGETSAGARLSQLSDDLATNVAEVAEAMSRVAEVEQIFAEGGEFEQQMSAANAEIELIKEDLSPTGATGMKIAAAVEAVAAIGDLESDFQDANARIQAAEEAVDALEAQLAPGGAFDTQIKQAAADVKAVQDSLKPTGTVGKQLADNSAALSDLTADLAGLDSTVSQLNDDVANAVSTAESAQTAASNAASAAETAKTAADAAKAKADAAASDLLALSGKTGRLIRSTTAPTATADKNSNNLWLNTSTGQLSQWTGTAWAVITDSRLTAAADAADQAANLANNAKTAADNAKTAAEAAQSLANTAKSTADAAKSEAEAAKSAAATADSKAQNAATDAAAAQAAADRLWAQAENRVYNPSFEDGTKGWPNPNSNSTLIEITDSKDGGTHAITHFSTSASTTTYAQNPDKRAYIGAGRKIRVGAWVRLAENQTVPADSPDEARLYVRGVSDAGGSQGTAQVARIGAVDLTRTWTWLEGIFSISANWSGAVLMVVGRSGAGGIRYEFDALVMQDVTEAVAAQTKADQAVTDAGNAKSAADAAAAAALKAQSAADDASAKATTASGLVTVASANPTTADAAGKPIGALWYVRSGGTMLRQYTLTGVNTWTQTLAGSDTILDNAITAAKIATKAIDAGKLADAVNQTISDAKAAGDKGISDAATAKAAADAAQTAANTAQSAAQSAQSKADTAASDLLTLAGKTGRVIRATTAPTGDDRNVNNLWLNTSNGQLSQWTGTAWSVITDSRLTAASSAADQAANLAGTAKTAADNAKTAADAAQSLASTAKSTADTAQAEAEAAKSAASTADSKAASAQSAAATAQGKANQAATDAANAAGIANGKADVLIQSTAPATAMRKATTLWIDTTGGANTPKRWSGSAWVDVTDKAATDAASAAAAAQSTANQAVTDAGNAKSAADAAAAAALKAQSAADDASAKATTASGLYTVATANPTTSDAAGKPIGAVWEVRSGGIAVRRYVLTAATTWTQVKIGTDFIGDGAIGRAQIGQAAVGTAEIADAAITNAKIGDLDAGKITAGILSSNRIGANSITAEKMLLVAGNLFPDPHTQDIAGWTGTGVSIVDDADFIGGKALQIESTTAAQRGTYYRGSGASTIALVPGATYRVRAKVKVMGTAGSRLLLYFRNTTGTVTLDQLQLVPTGAAVGTYDVDLTWKIPDAARGNGTVGIHTNTPFVAGSIFRVSDIKIQAMADASLVVEGSITANKIASKTITAASGVIADAAIGTAQIADAAIVQAKIGDLAVGTAQIANSAITNAKIGSAAIGTAEIADLAVTNGKIGDLDVGKLTASGTSKFTTAVMDTLLADAAFIKRLVAERVVITGMTDNLFANGMGELRDVGGWCEGVGGVYWQTTDMPAGTAGAFTTLPGTGTRTTNDPLVPITADELLAEVWIKADKPNSRIFIELRDQAGRNASSGNTILPGSTSTSNVPGTYILRAQLVPTEWTKYSIILRPNAVATSVRVSTIYFNHPIGTETNAAQSVLMRIRPRNAGELVVDGGIIARHLSADSVTANAIKAGTITATELATNAITADKISANAVTTAKIATNAVTANEIAANTITAANIKAGAITATEIAAGTITGTEIAANTVTAANVAANTITANEIKAGTITAKEIQAGTITAAEIAGSTITGEKIAANTIVAGNISAGTITATELASNSVTALKIASNAVTAVKIAAGAVTAGKIAANAVTANEIKAGSIDGMQITGAVITSAAPGSANRTYMDSNGLTVYAGSADQVKIGHGIETGMAVRQPGGAMVPLSRAVFGAQQGSKYQVAAPLLPSGSAYVGASGNAVIGAAIAPFVPWSSNAFVTSTFTDLTMFTTPTSTTRGYWQWFIYHYLVMRVDGGSWTRLTLPSSNYPDWDQTREIGSSEMGNNSEGGTKDVSGYEYSYTRSYTWPVTLPAGRNVEIAQRFNYQVNRQSNSTVNNRFGILDAMVSLVQA